jgi:hypothetical protein
MLPLPLMATSNALSRGEMVSPSKVLTGKAGILHVHTPKHGTGHTLFAEIATVGFFCMSFASVCDTTTYVVAFDVARFALALMLFMSVITTSIFIDGPLPEDVVDFPVKVNVSNGATSGCG